MASWISAITDLIQTGTQLYTATQGGGEVGRGGATVPPTMTVGSPAPPGMFTSGGMLGTPQPIAAAPLVGAMRAMVPRIMTTLGSLSRGAAGRRLVALTKTVGIQAAAAALGIGLAEALGLLSENVGRRRRARGISARDLRTTRRTTRRLIRASQDLSALATCVKVRRRSPCG